jgi:hypothetical protein
MSCTCTDGKIYKSSEYIDVTKKVCEANCGGSQNIRSYTENYTNTNYNKMNQQTYYILLIIQIIIWILMLICCISVINLCNNKPDWLQPTLIILFILWVLGNFFNIYIGFILFIILIIILIVYFNKCSNRNMMLLPDHSSKITFTNFMDA